MKSDASPADDPRAANSARCFQTLPETASRILVAHNPKAGARASHLQVDALLHALRLGGFQADVFNNLDDLQDAAAQVYPSGQLRAIVAAGGDGTAAEIVNRTPHGAPIALLPLGTENLLSRYLAQPKGPAAVGRLIEAGVTISLDAGQAGDRLFLLMCSVGPDAHIVEGLHSIRDGHITRLTYAKPILRTLRNYQYPEIRMHFQNDDGAAGDAHGAVTAHWIEAVNLPLYALGLRFAPAGVGTDGALDVCAFHRPGRIRNLWFLSQVAVGRHLRMADCSLTRCQRLRMESDADVLYQLDGDPAGRLPVDIGVAPGRLTILVSPKTARRLGFAEAESAR